MAAAVVSPSSSPRLPSPPPIAEDQTMPTSPGLSLSSDDGKLLGIAGNLDTGASRRIRPGTKRENIAEGPPLVELHEIDSAFQLTEHLKALHYSHTHSVGSHTIRPITLQFARQLARPPPNVDKEIWLYELARFLIQKTNTIIVQLFADTPLACSPSTCPEMRASEWQYLCAVHDPPKSCSAIDYCCHTLDWAATSLTSSKMFPSRLGLGSGNLGMGGGGDKVLQQQMKEITNIFRRVYRIYAHAWFQHREMFWRVEESTGLYILFKTVCDEYGMIQVENYTIPPEAEGGAPEQGMMAEGDNVLREERPTIPPPPVILRSEGDGIVITAEMSEALMENHHRVLSKGDTAKRHSRVPSHVAGTVSTVIQEEAEEEEEEEEEGKMVAQHSLPLVEASKEVMGTEEAESGEESAEGSQLKEEEGDQVDKVKEDAPVLLLGIARSDTVVPVPVEDVEESSTEVFSQDAGDPVQAEEEEGDEVTVLMSEEPELKADESGVEVTVEAVVPVAEPSSQVGEGEGDVEKAADGEKAGESVED